MGEPTPDLDYARDAQVLYRLNRYLYREWEQGKYLDSHLRWLWNWRAHQRHRRLGTAIDVLHELSRELHAQGRLNSPTMFHRAR